MVTLNFLVEYPAIFHPEKKRFFEGIMKINDNTGYFDDEGIDYSQTDNKMTQKIKGILFPGKGTVIKLLKLPYMDNSTNILYTFSKEEQEIKGTYSGSFLFSKEEFTFDQKTGLYTLNPKITINKSTKIEGAEFPAKLTLF
jgi:hypothetical protein